MIGVVASAEQSERFDRTDARFRLIPILFFNHFYEDALGLFDDRRDRSGHRLEHQQRPFR